ncbi:MAG: hypothetical protein ACREL7_08280 [Longimicrobiales bacterium]
MDSIEFHSRIGRNGLHQNCAVALGRDCDQFVNEIIHRIDHCCQASRALLMALAFLRIVFAVTLGHEPTGTAHGSRFLFALVGRFKVEEVIPLELLASPDLKLVAEQALCRDRARSAFGSRTGVRCRYPQQEEPSSFANPLKKFAAKANLSPSGHVHDCSIGGSSTCTAILEKDT